ncbi:zinc finger protein Xfin-like [Periophthalmus magnuspinnatus]|uniref:zinc finger protein Xfin-like n=1 Tax=Periophthalmus magnuspinnatus TaxID=409849 RepID=UPI0024369D6A|nr:zinc finger protein Xfin-like [Periophthalmus magnuspinnatus]
MSKKSEYLRALVTERLTAAAQDICALLERTVEEYEEELSRSKQESQRSRRSRRSQRSRSPTVRSAGVQTEAVYESPNENSNCSSSSEEVQAEGDEEEEEEALEEELEEELDEEPEEEGGAEAEETQTDLRSDSDEPKEHFEVLEGPFSCSAPETEACLETSKQTQMNDDSTEAQLPAAQPKSKLRKRRGRTKRSSIPFNTLKRKTKHQCSVCNKVLKGPPFNLLRHMIIHTGEKPFSCSVCGKTFTQQYLFKRHMETHQEEAEPSPTEQQKETQTGADEQSAECRQIKSEDCGVSQDLDTFGCPVCEKRFKRQVAFKKHMESHEAAKEQVRRHRRDAHTEGERERAEAKGVTEEREDNAPQPDSENGQDYTQATLMKSMHAASATATDHRCSVCDRAFTTKTRLKRHMIVHTGDKPFSCPVCNKCFSQKYNVRLHMAVHTDEKPFTCEICLKSYRRNDDLRTHMATHTGQVLFSCMVCNTGFKQRNCLVSHMRLHTGDRPYRCPMCSKTFIQKSNLNRHVRSHTGEKPFRCPVCPQRFVQKSDIRKHMSIHT